MRLNILTRTLVTVTAVAGITTGGLVGTGFTAPQPAPVPAASASVLAVNNLGLTTTQARHWQCWLDGWGFDPGTIDGQLGTNSWKAAQRFFNYYELYVGRKLVVDGAVGTNTIKALQNWLGVGIDGIAGPATKGAFAAFNNTDYC
ncbi:peptidoglycan-binding domain-containing protein [Streptomyces acidiscabies]|uniref:peptidoglycan-binding domain-containing protein n=1 Tax=Streptomyces acidiscabies TaxID=42234 RepID=UPI0038F6207A